MCKEYRKKENLSREEFLKMLDTKVKNNKKLPFKKRFKLAIQNMYDDWNLRHFYKRAWFLNSIVNAISLIIGKKG